jgi:hypothetical protein
LSLPCASGWFDQLTSVPIVVPVSGRTNSAAQTSVSNTVGPRESRRPRASVPRANFTYALWRELYALAIACTARDRMYFWNSGYLPSST